MSWSCCADERCGVFDAAACDQRRAFCQLQTCSTAAALLKLDEPQVLELQVNTAGE
jgi:hypothetical protein